MVIEQRTFYKKNSVMCKNRNRNINLLALNATNNSLSNRTFLCSRNYRNPRSHPYDVKYFHTKVWVKGDMDTKHKILAIDYERMISLSYKVVSFIHEKKNFRKIFYYAFYVLFEKFSYFWKNYNHANFNNLAIIKYLSLCCDLL